MLPFFTADRIAVLFDLLVHTSLSTGEGEVFLYASRNRFLKGVSDMEGPESEKHRQLREAWFPCFNQNVCFILLNCCFMERKPYVRVEFSLDDVSEYQPEYLDYLFDIQLVFPEFPPETYELAVRVFSENFIPQGVHARYLGGKGPRRINFQIPVLPSCLWAYFYIFVYRNGMPYWFGKFYDPDVKIRRAYLELLDPSSEEWFFAAYMMKGVVWDEFCQKNFNRSVVIQLIHLLHRRRLQEHPERFLAVSGKYKEAQYFAEKILGNYLNDDLYYTTPIAELSMDDLVSGEVRWKQVAGKLQKAESKVILIGFSKRNYCLDELQAIKRQIARLRNFEPGIHTTYIFYGHPDLLALLQECCSRSKPLFPAEACIDLDDRSNKKFEWS